MSITLCGMHCRWLTRDCRALSLKTEFPYSLGLLLERVMMRLAKHLSIHIIISFVRHWKNVDFLPILLFINRFILFLSKQKGKSKLIHYIIFKKMFFGANHKKKPNKWQSTSKLMIIKLFWIILALFWLEYREE